MERKNLLLYRQQDIKKSKLGRQTKLTSEFGNNLEDFINLLIFGKPSSKYSEKFS